MRKMNRFKKTTRVGVVSIDRSGSKADLPITITAVYSEKVGNFDKAVRDVRNYIKHEVKRGKDFKPTDFVKTINTIIGNDIKFLTYVVDRNTLTQIEETLRKKQNWSMILEAYLWYKTISLLIKKTSLPAEIIYERTYTGSGTDVFDNVFKKLLSDRFGIDKGSVTIGEKTSPYIMLADWIGHFFYSSLNLSNIFKQQTIFCRIEFVKRDLESLLGIKKQSAPHARAVHDTAANLRMSGTINTISYEIFKDFDFRAFYGTEFKGCFV